MRGNQHSYTMIIKVMKQIKNLIRKTGIKVSCRLISDQQARSVNNSAGNAYTLLFATSKSDWFCPVAVE